MELNKHNLLTVGGGGGQEWATLNTINLKCLNMEIPDYFHFWNENLENSHGHHHDIPNLR